MTPNNPKLQPDPANPFEIALAEKFEALTARVDALTSRLNWLLTVIVGAVIVNLALALTR